MIHYVQGDIILSKSQLIAHGIAPGDHFLQGLALTLRERWPAMAKDFRHYCHLTNPKAGGAWLWGGPGVMIANLLTQEPAPSVGQVPGKATLSAIAGSLKALRRLVEEEGITSLALPRLATGVGGQDWDDVKPLIEQHLGDLAIPVYVYDVYRANVAAE